MTDMNKEFDYKQMIKKGIVNVVLISISSLITAGLSELEILKQSMQSGTSWFYSITILSSLLTMLKNLLKVKYGMNIP